MEATPERNKKMIPMKIPDLEVAAETMPDLVRIELGYRKDTRRNRRLAKQLDCEAGIYREPKSEKGAADV